MKHVLLVIMLSLVPNNTSNQEDHCYPTTITEYAQTIVCMCINFVDMFLPILNNEYFYRPPKPIEKYKEYRIDDLLYIISLFLYA